MQPSRGARIKLNAHFATIRFIGPVHGTSGTWLGVEWDIPHRGKHDGTKDGKQYFTCRVKGAGSFIRPTPNIIYGVPFLEALKSKYIEALHGSDTQETIVLGSSQGTIQVEAVSLDKIRHKFGNLASLREVSLDNEYTSLADPPGAIAQTCPNIRGLDLSATLLSSWDTVAQITRELPLLQTLSLNHTRLQLPSSSHSLRGSFPKLLELRLNAALLTWPEMQLITTFMPNLQLVEMGYNHLEALSRGPCLFDNPAIQVVNLDGNACCDWVNICASLKHYPSLQRVILTSNQIETIPFPDDPQHSLPRMEHISLSSNLITAWLSIDALSCWFPALISLTLSGNPLVNDDHFKRHSRPLIVARLPSLMMLDGASISSKERTDCELFYMSTIVQEAIPTDIERSKKHYQWRSLCAKHGVPDHAQTQIRPQERLSSRLIELQLYEHSDSKTLPDGTKRTVRVLPTMTLRNLRLKLCKLLKYNPRATTLVCKLRMKDGSLTELELQYDLRELDWLGIEDGCHIIYQNVH